MKPFQIYLIAIILVECILATSLYFASLDGTAFCLSGESCTKVQNSEYGTIAGIKVSLFGAIIFAALAIFYYYSRNSYKRYRFFFAATLLGAAMSTYFIVVQLFVLDSICSSCMIIDGLMYVITIMAAIEFYKLRKYY